MAERQTHENMCKQIALLKSINYTFEQRRKKESLQGRLNLIHLRPQVSFQSFEEPIKTLEAWPPK